MRIAGLVALGCAFVAAFAPARAQQDFPNRTVRIVMPFPPGSGTDILARILADELTGEWGKTVYVENVVGGVGKIGAQQVYRAQPDGYTLMVAPPPPLVIAQSLIKDWGMDSARWTKICILTSVPYVLAARPDFPANDVQGMVALARANPGKLTYMSSNVGSTAQLSTVQIETRANIKMVHVAYNGAAAALTSLMASQTDIGFDITTTAEPAYRDKKIKFLGIGSPQRAPSMPEVPTIAEQGFPGYRSVIWFGFIGPPGMPAPLVDKINATLTKILHKPAIIERLRNLGQDAVAATPAESAKFFDDEIALWGGIIRDGDVKIE